MRTELLGRLAHSHKSLLDLLVRTDTNRGVGRGGRGCTDPLIPRHLRCPICGELLRYCSCRSSGEHVL